MGRKRRHGPCSCAETSLEEREDHNESQTVTGASKDGRHGWAGLLSQVPGPNRRSDPQAQFSSLFLRF